MDTTEKVKGKVDAVADQVKVGVDKAGAAIHDAAEGVANKIAEVGGKLKAAVDKK